MNIKLRLEQPSDYRETENMIREAFWNHFTPGCTEHYLMHIMRGCREFLHELDYVAVHEEKVVGNVAYMTGVIKGDNGRIYEVIGLGPVSVLPEYQHRGVGSNLIACTKEMARGMGYRAILLYGDPDYYARHGFIKAEQLNIRTWDNMYAVPLQICELYEGAMSGISGRYMEHPIFELDETAVSKFDKDFPIKNKITGSPSQERFNLLVSMRRSAE